EPDACAAGKVGNSQWRRAVEIELEVQATSGSIAFVEHETIAVGEVETRGDGLHGETDESDKRPTSYADALSLYYKSDN
ncbi:hypothetical protein KXW54_005619, partial [Aspergillus fumigatus]